MNTSIEHNKGDDLLAQAFTEGNGKTVLMLNKRNRAQVVKLPADLHNAQIAVVDETLGDNEPIFKALSTDEIELKPFAVALIKTNN